MRAAHRMRLWLAWCALALSWGPRAVDGEGRPAQAPIALRPAHPPAAMSEPRALCTRSGRAGAAYKRGGDHWEQRQTHRERRVYGAGRQPDGVLAV